MAIRSSSQLGVGRDDSRWSPGFSIAAGVTLYGGLVVTNDVATDSTKTGKILKAFGNVNGIPNTSNPIPIGLVYENTLPFSPPASSDTSAGYGFDIRDFARGGLYSVFHNPGNLVDVFDDFCNTAAVTRNNLDGTAGPSQGTSATFLTNLTYALGDKLYATNEGLLSNQTPGALAVSVGIVRAVSGTGANMILSVELHIDTQA
jgi:hypothetical protein